MLKIRGFEVAKGFEDKGINLPIRGTANAAGYDFEAAEDIVIPSLFMVGLSYRDNIERILTKEFFGKSLTEKELSKLDPDELFGDDPVKMMEMLGKFSLLMTKLDIDMETLLTGGGDISNLFDPLSSYPDDILEGVLSQESIEAAKEEAKKFKPILVPTGIKAYMGDSEYLQLSNRSSGPLKQFLLMSNGVGIIDADYYGNSDNDGHIMFQFINFGPDNLQIKKGDRIGQGTFLPFLIADNDTASGERVGGHGSTGLNKIN